MVFFTCTTATGTSSFGASVRGATGDRDASVVRATLVRSTCARPSSPRCSRSAVATATSLPSTVCVTSRAIAATWSR